MGTNKANLIQSKLDDIIQYLKPMLPFVNCHMVNFLTGNYWDNFVPDAIRIEVEEMGIGTMFELFRTCAKNSNLDSRNYPFLMDYLTKARSMSLCSLANMSLSRSEFCEILKSWNCDKLDSLHLEQFMSRKKTHEVEVMSGTVSALAWASGSSHIVDVGGGKGYLSSMLALHHGLQVLSVDSSQVNTQGAAKRTERLQKVWDGICRRADAINGDIPIRRGKHWKSKNQESHSALNSDTVTQHKLENIKITEESANNSSGVLREKACGENSKSNSLYKQATVFVTKQTKLEALIEENFDCPTVTGISLIGLHTCGDLASTCLHLFVNNAQIKSLCNVGCCYHLIEEQFFRNPFWSSGDAVLPEVGYGFPMSQFLIAQRFALGRNARMLAAQSLDRISDQEQVASKSLFYRALLQVLLLQLYGEELPQWQVGRLASKSRDFQDYVRRAFTKLKINTEVSTDEVEALYERYSSCQQKLQTFFLLRVALAPVVEAVVLLDRLLFLHEQGIQDTHLVQLFDAVVSPRCYGLVALKR